MTEKNLSLSLSSKVRKKEDILEGNIERVHYFHVSDSFQKHSFSLLSLSFHSHRKSARKKETILTRSDGNDESFSNSKLYFRSFWNHFHTLSVSRLVTSLWNDLMRGWNGKKCLMRGWNPQSQFIHSFCLPEQRGFGTDFESFLHSNNPKQ